jgi:hypothetical protein
MAPVVVFARAAPAGPILFGVFMRRNLYMAAFLAVLLVACAGGFWGARVFFNRMQNDFTPRTGWTPAATDLATVGTPAPGPTDAEATSAAIATEPRLATATVLVVPAPVTDQPAVLTPEPTWTAGVELPTIEPGFATETPVGGDIATPEPSATPIPAYPFALARAVRYTSGDCPGTYALGLVTDRNGNPLPGIRLSLVDEFGNASTAVTKPGPGDTGRYDFPMGGPPRRFFITVVDDAERPLSPSIEVLHDLPPQEGKGCRWIDWRRN